MDLWKDDIRTRTAPPTTIDLKNVPTLTELEHQMRLARPSKAMGYDQVPPELLHYSAAHLARHTWPLFFKQTLLASECLQHKGGRLVSAWKRRGDIRQCSQHRALLVSSSLGKSFHNVFRRRILGQVRSVSTPLQVTSHNSPSVTLAAQVVLQSCHSSQTWWIYQLLTLFRHCASVLQSNSPAGL